jgi:CelD/BcsL family acetyltransferase involved in cellulose biosynthesis
MQDTTPPPAWDVAGVSPERAFLCQPWFDAFNHVCVAGTGWTGPVQTLVACNEQGATIGALPLATLTRQRLRFRALAGWREPFRSIPVDADAIVAATAGLAADLERACAGHVGLVLGPVPAADPGVDTLVGTLVNRGWMMHQTLTSQDFVTPLSATMDELYRRLPPGYAKKAVQRERRAAKEPGFELSVHRALPPDAWASVIRDVAHVESRSWLVAEGGDTHFSKPEHQRFWAAFLSDPRAQSFFSIFIVRIAGVPACYDIAIDVGRTRYILYGHYDEAWKALSLGGLLDHEVLRGAVSLGMASVHFGQGDNGYKQKTLGARPAGARREILLCPPGWRGRALMFAALGRTLVQQWRPPRPE